MNPITDPAILAELDRASAEPMTARKPVDDARLLRRLEDPQVGTLHRLAGQVAEGVVKGAAGLAGAPVDLLYNLPNTVSNWALSKVMQAKGASPQDIEMVTGAFPNMAGGSDTYRKLAEKNGLLGNSAYEPQNPGEKVLSGAAEGASMLAPLGPAGAIVGGVGGGVGAAAGEAVRGLLPRAPSWVAPTAEVVAGAIAGGVPGLARGVARTAVPLATDAAVERGIARAFNADNVQSADVVRTMREAQASKEPVSLYQLGGENTRRLARASAGQIGEGTDLAVAKIKEQNAGMSGRVRGDVNRAFKGSDAFEMEPELLNRLNANANEAYGKFYQSVPYVWSKDLAEMFQSRPSMRDAIGAAMKNAAEAGKPFGITRAKDGKFMTAEDFQKGEAIQALTSPAVDDVKRALDGIIDTNKNEFTGKLNNYGRLVNDTKKQFLDAVEKADPSGLYKAARAQYAGDAEVIQALRDGRVFATMDPRAIRQFMSEASFAERDAFRSGMQDAIEQSIMKTKGDKTKALFRNDEWTQEQLQAALTPQEYRQMKRRVDSRKQGWEDRQFVSPRTGSQTQLRLAEAGDAIGDTVADIGRGRSIMGAIADRLVVQPYQAAKTRAAGVSPATAPAYAKRLFADDPAMLQRLLMQIEARRIGLNAPARQLGFGPTAGGLAAGYSER